MHRNFGITKISRNVSVSFDHTFREILRKFRKQTILRNFGRFRQFRSTNFSNLRSIFGWSFEQFANSPLLIIEREFKNLKWQKFYEFLLVRNLQKFCETLLTETDRNFDLIWKTREQFLLEIVNMLIFIDNRLEIGKRA